MGDPRHADHISQVDSGIALDRAAPLDPAGPRCTYGTRERNGPVRRWRWCCSGQRAPSEPHAGSQQADTAPATDASADATTSKAGSPAASYSRPLFAGGGFRATATSLPASRTTAGENDPVSAAKTRIVIAHAGLSPARPSSPATAANAPVPRASTTAGLPSA